MRYITLDFGNVADREGLHWLLFSEMHFPEHYGANLDALWDCLSEISRETTLDLVNLKQLKTTLGSYADKFLITLEQATASNPKLHIIQEEEAV